ncbi:DUF2017 family protein [Micropruina sp.]|uniref:DUF2017 family protein n=1 Tax=Micropruina sp. TaxID=2737536 RepID=UPI0039E5CB14
MSRFKKSGSQLLITLADYEEAVLESLVEQLIGLLEGEDVRSAPDDQFARWEAEMAEPDGLDTSDPVIARLFPSAYRNDPGAEQEFPQVHRDRAAPHQDRTGAGRAQRSDRDQCRP